MNVLLVNPYTNNQTEQKITNNSPMAGTLKNTPFIQPVRGTLTSRAPKLHFKLCKRKGPANARHHLSSN